MDLSLLGQVLAQKIEAGSQLCDLLDLVPNYCQGWEAYVKFETENYHRCLVTRNTYLDVVVISWNPNQMSGLHDHPSEGCILHLISGCLTEDLYITECEKLVPTKTRTLEPGATSFLQGKGGIHNIRNGTQTSVSIHVYAPPNYKLSYYTP